MESETDRRSSGRLGWLRDLLAQVFSTDEIVSPGRYCAYNAFAGVILLGIAVVVRLESGRGGVAGALALGIMGLVMLASIPAALLRPGVVPPLLVLQGSLYVLLALRIAWDSVAWALHAPPFAPFRYLPGLVLIVLCYGTLQAAGFGPWAARARALRIAGLVAGLACEVVIGVALLYRAFQR